MNSTSPAALVGSQSEGKLTSGGAHHESSHDILRPRTSMTGTRPQSQQKPTSPGFSFGGAGVSRENVNRNQLKTPGPGTYADTPNVGHSAPRVGFGTSRRDKITSRQYAGPLAVRLDPDLSPGPSAYSIKTGFDATNSNNEMLLTLGTQADKAPAFSFGPRPGTTSYKPQQKAENDYRPGPGHYARVDPFQSNQAYSFGSSGREYFSKQYYGTGLAKAAVTERRNHVKLKDPLDTKEVQYRKNQLCEPELSRPMSSIGPQVEKTSAPAFSFGGGRARTASPNGEKGRANSPPGQGLDRTSWSTQNLHDTGSKKGKSTTFNLEPDSPESAYNWLQSYSKPKKRVTYSKIKDGTDMSKAKEFHQAPEFSFGKSKRFDGAPGEKDNSPGPIYALKGLVGPSGPAFSFPTTSDRTSPEFKKAIKEQTPGPGAYNMLLEHRLDGWIEESLGENNRRVGTASAQSRGATRADKSRGVNLGSTADSLTTMDQLALNSPRDESPDGFTNNRLNSPDSRPQSPNMQLIKELKQSIRQDARSLYTMSETLNLKFGPNPTKEAAPSYGFGTSTREMRTKHFQPGELNREFAGTFSPGPTTALHDMCESVTESQPHFSFGGKDVARNPILSKQGPGPAKFGGISGLGEQPLSVRPTAPIYSFGSSGRGDIQKLYNPGGFTQEQSTTPGPIYDSHKPAFASKIGPRWVTTK